MEQLGFEGMPRRLYACTPTRLSTWLDCPRRYRMSYLDRPAPPKGPPWAHNSLGASVHNALAGWWRLPRRDRTVTAAGDLLESGWLSDGFADTAQSAAHRQRCRQMVEGYVAGLDPAGEPAGVERTVATRTDLIAVSGRIDRLDDRRPANAARREQPGELVVVDYKTGRHRLTVDDARTSLRAGAVRAGGRAGAAATVPDGGAAPPAHRQQCWPGSTRRSRWPGSSAGRGHRGRVRRRRRAVQEPRPLAVRRPTRSSGRGQAPAAAGAITARTARRAARPRRGAVPGTGCALAGNEERAGIRGAGAPDPC